MNDKQTAGTSRRRDRSGQAATTIDERDTKRVDLVEIALRGSAHDLLDRVQWLRERRSRPSPLNGQR